MAPKPTAEQIAQLIQGRRSGAGWIGRCPAHEDRSPSLKIDERDGKILLCCFAGCSLKEIYERLGISVSDLFSESRAFQPKPHALRQAEVATADLRHRLTPRERVLPVTVVETDRAHIDAAIARALALAVEGEIVQVALVEEGA
jgi:CHC2 zinc finger